MTNSPPPPSLYKRLIILFLISNYLALSTPPPSPIHSIQRSLPHTVDPKIVTQCSCHLNSGFVTDMRVCQRQWQKPGVGNGLILNLPAAEGGLPSLCVATHYVPLGEGIRETTEISMKNVGVLEGNITLIYIIIYYVSSNERKKTTLCTKPSIYTRADHASLDHSINSMPLTCKRLAIP